MNYPGLIARFLDWHGALTAKAIRAKQRLIRLLEEQKQTIIHHAATRGLDSGVRLKPPVISWLGEFPEGWEVIPLKRVAITWCDGPFGSGLKSSHYVEEGIRVIRLQNIGFGYFKDADAAFISEGHYKTLGDHSVVRNDLLIAGLGDDKHPPGRACVAPEDIESAMVKADCFRFRLRQDRVNPAFIAHYLTSTAVAATAALSAGATRQRINLQSTAARPVFVPPISEQCRIVSYIEANTGDIFTAINTIEREISVVREFHACLVADVVTGKLDVQSAAASLPEMMEEPELLDVPEAVDDLEEADEDDSDLAEAAA